MTSRNLHLNLLRPQERRSSSPVRLHVMLPVLMMLATVAMALWWAMVYVNLLVVRHALDRQDEELRKRSDANTAALSVLGEVSELEAELKQLDAYRNGRAVWGDTLKGIAEVLPAAVQLTRLEVPMPPMEEVPVVAPGAQPPLGPTGTVERVVLFLNGRTTRDLPLVEFLRELQADRFTNRLVTIKGERQGEGSPRVLSFRQDIGYLRNADAPQLLAFKVEFTARERRFEP